MRIRHCSATVWGALSWQVRHEDMRSEELSQSACLFLLQETWLVQSQGHGLTARSRACKKCERRSASQRNEKNVRLQKSTAWEKPRSRAALRDQTYDFPENRKAIEWIAADTERALWCHEMSTQHSLLFCGFFVSVGETVMRRKHRFFREERYIWWIGNTIYTS